MAQVFTLYRLQTLDSQIDRTRQRLGEITAALAEDSALQAARQNSERAQQGLEVAQKQLRQAEASVQAQRIKIEQNQSTLYGGKVRNPKELQDLQQEGEALRRQLSVLEDAQLEIMVEIEEKQAALDDATRLLKQVEQERAQSHAQLKGEQSSLERDLEHGLQERQVTSSSIAPEEIAQYDKLRQKRGGVAVAKVTDRACSACGSVLNAALLHSARSPAVITLCDNCGRILYGG